MREGLYRDGAKQGTQCRPLLRASSPLKPKINRGLTLRLVQRTGALQMQDAYVRAYQHLAQFAGRAKFSTWLTRIAVHEALARLEDRGRLRYLEEMSGPESPASDVVHSQEPTPEQYVSSREHARVLERAV